MDAATAIPPDLLTVAAPLSRGPPGPARPPGARDPDGPPTVAPFDLLLQLLAAGMPAGQTLPAGGSDLPAATATTPSAAAPATAPAAVPQQPAVGGGAQAPSTDLADWLRLALARVATPLAATPTDPTAAAAASSALTDASAQPAPSVSDPARTPAAPAPVDLATLLGTDTSAEAPAQPLVALATATHERIASDSTRRSSASITPADRAAELASSLASADTKHAAEVEAPAVAVTAPAASAKIASLDDADSLVVVPTASTDSTGASASTLPPLAPAPTPHAAAATSAASAQGSLPPHLSDAVDATSKQWHDALATRIQWLVDHDIGEAKIKLNPPELGALDVKISLLDDKTFVQMTAHNASARDELAQGLPRLRELLSLGGLELGGATVSAGHDDRGAFGSAPQPVMRAAPFAATAEALPDSPRPRLGMTAAVIDTFA